LEDDITSRSGFISDIKKHINSRPVNQTKWLMIEYSPLGFIGKMFRTSNLTMFINFFMLFSNYKPVDMLHDAVFATVVCDLHKDWVFFDIIFVLFLF
jgi:alpha-1,3-mannosylglycoprotein beta-1,4-N-acetylglucosaminyltransferase A/B